MTKNFLNGKRAYLSGPIEHGEGENWRVGPCQFLTDKLGVDLFDPFSDPKQQWVHALKEAQKNKDYELIVKISKSFVRKDLCLVDRSDFIIAYLPHKIPTTGTHHEIINSNNAKKPTLLVTNCGDISYLPLWYFGFIPVEFMFPTWDKLYSYLEEVNEGKHQHNNRWSYIYGNI
jgi:nucleoside 2-deoxyribosyltransferase